MRLTAAALALAALTATPAAAESGSVTTYLVQESFEDAAFGIETAIVGHGLVVDHVSRVGEMLNRTQKDVGAATKLYKAANVYLFCSAVLSRQMMEADPDNIAHCPYSVFVYELAATPGTVHIGYRNQPTGPMQEVQQLLDAIAREAAGLK